MHCTDRARAGWHALHRVVCPNVRAVLQRPACPVSHVPTSLRALQGVERAGRDCARPAVHPVDASEGGAGEGGAGEGGADEGGADELGADERGADKLDAGERRRRQGGAGEEGAGERGAAELGADVGRHIERGKPASAAHTYQRGAGVGG